MKLISLSCLINLAAIATAFYVPSSEQHRSTKRYNPIVQFATPPEDETWMDEQELKTPEGTSRRNLIINAVGVGLLGASGWASASLYKTNVYTPDGFQRIYPTQFIAALGDPKAKAGTGATDWGLWRVDPGPRGVWLKQYESQLAQQNNLAPAGWTFDPNNWWVEEHGLIMEAPDFPLPPGRYLVTGGRTTTTGLTIDAQGGWKLDEGSLYDVTHLPCRSAKYTPDTSSPTIGSPLTANPSNFPVAPGAPMPPVQGCNKQDYAVLFVVGKVVGKSENRA